ncbi:uncharacterized protein [Musca autumnalis]|uniref:uncharacterized protein n=1 Tax=Musca autumnalis TaxID=221902 RepID=UPI003CF1A4ED
MEESHKLEMLRSVKGKDMLLIDGYLYHYDDRTSKSYRWVCSRRKDKTPCRVRIHTTLIDEWDLTRHKLESILGEHPHGPADEHTIIRARDKKRQADAEGLPCTLSNKSLKRKYQMQKGGGDSLVLGNMAKKTKTTAIDGDDDDVSSVDGIIEMVDSSFELMAKAKSRSSTVGDKKVLMLKTAKGYHMIAVEGCVYRLDGKSMLSCTYRWKCFRSKDLQCSGRIYTECLASGMHRYKPFRVEENKHNHQPYTDAKIEALIRRNNIKIIHGQEDQPKAADGEITTSTTNGKKSNKSNTPLSVTHGSGGQVLSISTNIEIPAKTSRGNSTRREKALATAALYRYVKDPKEVLKNPQDGDIKLFSFLPSFKGNRVLILDNMIYHFDSRGVRNDRIYWTCLFRRYKNKRCNCRLTTENEGDKIQIVKVSGDHSHTTDHRQHIERRLQLNLLVKDDPDQKTQDDSFGNDDNPLYHSDDDNDGGTANEEDDYYEDKHDSTAADVSEFLRLNKLKKEKREEEVTMEIAEDVIDAKEAMTEEYKEEMDPFCDTIEYVEMERINNSSQFNHSDFSAEESEDQNHIPLPKVRNKKKTKRSTDYIEDNEGDDDDENNDDDFGDDEEYSPPPVKTKSSNNYNSPTRGVRYSSSQNPKNPDNIDITKVSKLRSAKGGELLCVDGYIYHLKSISPTTRTYWSCIKSKDRVLKCPARVTTITLEDNQLKVVYLSNSHSHPISEDDIKKRLFNEFAKSSTTNVRPKDIMDKSLSELNPELAQMLTGKNVESSSFTSSSTPRVKTEKCKFNIKLYASTNDPPSLAVRMCLKALDIPYELHNVDYFGGEHLSDEYAKINPQKEIPLLDDDGFHLPESSAIMQYLCEKYAAESSSTFLYPQEIKERALVLHRLCFNMTNYYSSIAAYCTAPIYFDYQRNEMGQKKVENALQVFETFLKSSGTRYAAGTKLSIADFALVSATLCLEGIGYDFSKYELVAKWYQRFKQEYPQLWDIARGGMQEISEMENNPPDLSHINHPYHPIRKM